MPDLTIPFLDLAAEAAATRDQVQDAINRVLSSGWFILGPEVQAFEQEFAGFVGAQHGIGVASGTDALHLALRACDIGPGDEVITVPNTAVATVAAIEMAGARPVFADIHPVTMNMDPDSAAAAVTPRTKALLPVHLYGQTADLFQLLELARSRGLRVIEDACQAHGALHQGRPVGGIGDIGCFSFYPTKNLGGYGDGGMAVTSDPHLAERLRLLRTYGWAERDRSVIRGVNSRLDELQAAILRVKLTHLDAWTTSRRALADRYQSALGGIPWLRLPGDVAHGRHVYHLFVVRTPHRDRLRAYLAERGIGTLVHYPTPIYLQDAYRDLGLGPGTCPVAEEAAGQILSLPLHPHLTEAEVDAVCEAIRTFSPA